MPSAGGRRQAGPLLGAGQAAFFVLVLGTLLLILASKLRNLPYLPNPHICGDFEILSALLAFIFACMAMVRFNGTHDRVSLVLGLGFLLSALLNADSGLVFYRSAAANLSLHLRAPFVWWGARLFLALLLVAALIVEKYSPPASNPGREIAVAVLCVFGLAILTSTAYSRLPIHWVVRPGALITRP
jgi:hypothetical protein